MPPVNRSRIVVWRPLIVCPQPDVYRRLQAVLTELAVEQPCTLTEYPRSGAIAALVERNACNICFLDAATDCEHAQTADLGAGAVGPCRRVAPSRRCGSDPALPAPRRVRVRCRPHGRRCGRRIRAAGAHTLGCRVPCARCAVLCDTRQTRLRWEYARGQHGGSVAQRRRKSGPAGGWRPVDRQYRVHAQIEARVSPGRCAARLDAHG